VSNIAVERREFDVDTRSGVNVRRANPSGLKLLSQF
jgi:hypothetical protein